MPGIALTAQRIRFAADASAPMAMGILTNVLNAAPIALPSGTALQFELLFYFQKLVDANLIDLTQFAEINIGLCANADPHSGTIYYQASIAAENFNTGATVEVWGGNTAASAHITVAIPSAQNVVPPGSTNYWLVVWGVSTDGAGDDVLLFAGKIAGQDSGIPSGPPSGGSPVKVGSKISFVCSDGMTRDLVLMKTPNGQWTTEINPVAYNGPGQGSWAMEEPGNTGVFHDISLANDSGVWGVVVNQNGHS